MICNASSGAGCAARWCRTARFAAVWLSLAGPAGAVEPSGSTADPFAKPAAPVAAQPTDMATPSKDSTGVAELKPIETPYVPYHATATSPWSPRAVEPPPPADGYTLPADATATPGSIFETIFDPDKLVPVVLPAAPEAPPATTGDAMQRDVAPRQAGAATIAPAVMPQSTDGAAFDPPVVDTGKMTPVTFGPPKKDPPANPAKPTKKKAAAPSGTAPVGEVDARRTSGREPSEPSAAKPPAVRPAEVKPPITTKYHLPQPPIPLP